MENQLITNPAALPLFFNEDVFLVKSEYDAPKVSSITDAEVVANVRSSEIEQPAAAVVSALAIPEEKPIPVMPKIEFKFKGNNKKNILILVNDATNDVSNAEGVELLRKLVKAIGLQGADFALVNYANYPKANYQQLYSFFKCQLLLSFGITASDLGLNELTLHRLTRYNEVQMVFTNNLAALAGDNPTKIILWKSLQQLNNG